MEVLLDVMRHGKESRCRMDAEVEYGMGLLDAMWCALLGSDQSAHDNLMFSFIFL